MKIYAYTSVGTDKREENQDCILIQIGTSNIIAADEYEETFEINDAATPVRVALMDGLGGHENGKLASYTMAKLLAESDLRGRLEDDVNSKNRILTDMKTGGMTTITAVHFDPEKKQFSYINCGDTRLYGGFKGEEPLQLSKDDSTEQLYIKCGFTKADARKRSKIIRCMGADLFGSIFSVEEKVIDTECFDYLILMTDGAYDIIEPNWYLVLNNECPPESLIRFLQKGQENKLCTDNTSVVILELK